MVQTSETSIFDLKVQKNSKRRRPEGVNIWIIKKSSWRWWIYKKKEDFAIKTFNVSTVRSSWDDKKCAGRSSRKWIETRVGCRDHRLKNKYWSLGSVKLTYRISIDKNWTVKISTCRKIGLIIRSCRLIWWYEYWIAFTRKKENDWLYLKRRSKVNSCIALKRTRGSKSWKSKRRTIRNQSRSWTWKSYISIYGNEASRACLKC